MFFLLYYNKREYEHFNQQNKSRFDILEYLVYATKRGWPALASTAAGATNEP
jgi:hypothetical protein